ncbi:hypothetical protein OCS_01022 [Ophiocordyceps sinensis CO18]|uniref:Uncharacterized protein n=1 Tax=Ophiocordyceps sinensis (strain Co18 / CGMCC 3.14243) TaxID=911162 RepID=T5ANE7_OPHSC|nr:hypothetical protein OCS_01022 [Ophiocordyceps sinensis CO18]
MTSDICTKKGVSHTAVRKRCLGLPAGPHYIRADESRYHPTSPTTRQRSRIPRGSGWQLRPSSSPRSSPRERVTAAAPTAMAVAAPTAIPTGRSAYIAPNRSRKPAIPMEAILSSWKLVYCSESFEETGDSDGSEVIFMETRIKAEPTNETQLPTATTTPTTTPTLQQHLSKALVASIRVNNSPPAAPGSAAYDATATAADEAGLAAEFEAAYTLARETSTEFEAAHTLARETSTLLRWAS